MQLCIYYYYCMFTTHKLHYGFVIANTNQSRPWLLRTNVSALVSSWTNDWSRNDLEVWDESYFGDCRGKVIQVRFLFALITVGQAWASILGAILVQNSALHSSRHHLYCRNDRSVKSNDSRVLNTTKTSTRTSKLKNEKDLKISMWRVWGWFSNCPT